MLPLSFQMIVRSMMIRTVEITAMWSDKFQMIVRPMTAQVFTTTMNAAI